VRHDTITGNAIRRIVIDQSYRAQVGHIGSSLSVADLLAVLYGQILREPKDPARRDRFILSKGHAALGLYAALHLAGILTKTQLDSYCGDGTLLGVHPECQLPGIDFATGSLGQGLSVGAGAALAGRLHDDDRRVFVLMSDAECNEGSIWEAAMFAAHHRLNNLVAIIDLNGQQALGHTEQVLCLTNMAQRFRSFGWDTREIDGHDMVQIKQAIPLDLDRPRVVIARTTFGKGVSYMEGQIKWHYWPMNPQDYEQACRELAP
jgi:transketolase